MGWRILEGDNRNTLKTLEDNSIDAIVTDPPYGIDFLGKAWDANTGALETYEECYRVLKPGGYILAFSAARTYHHLAVTLERAGFEIRDQLMWLYSSGFPKAQDIGKAIQRCQGVEETKPQKGLNAFTTNNQMGWSSQEKEYGRKKEEVIPTSPEAQQWAGWKTALKPAHEPICMARKPFKGSTIDNVLEHGVGALNIDATRIPWDEAAQKRIDHSNAQGGIPIGHGISKYASIGEDVGKTEEKALLNTEGRYPSNVIGEVAEGYQKYFYCPKVSRKERHTGFDLTQIPTDPSGFIKEGVQHNHSNRQSGNNHPTVKPVELMKYLIKLVTPAGGVVLDPFCGSGSTGMAAVELDHEFIGCELDPDYASIADCRIQSWNNPDYGNTYHNLFE